jgi:hypothetical protein
VLQKTEGDKKLYIYIYMLKQETEADIKICLLKLTFLMCIWYKYRVGQNLLDKFNQIL